MEGAGDSVSHIVMFRRLGAKAGAVARVADGDGSSGSGDTLVGRSEG